MMIIAKKPVRPIPASRRGDRFLFLGPNRTAAARRKARALPFRTAELEQFAEPVAIVNVWLTALVPLTAAFATL